MPGPVEGNTPSYISSQSADVILSDVRPFKLKTEALHAINVLLDEFLYNILNTSGSLLTDRLRASLLTLLPTSLGKEALLEAEVELRAYWDRTTAEGGPIPELEDDSKTFHLQWAFGLLRLKCEAYSTLNESDEDPFVEGRIQERFAQAVAVPPSAALLAPAALYLTAILEAMCEHILTNVGRVAARDSSRVNATVNDLFTALCEDDSIYGLFRSMRVYEQIELLSKGPVKSRRSKSFSRSELSTTLTSRTGSPHQDLSLGKDSISNPRARLSSEVSSSTILNMPGATVVTSRTSFEKARSIKLFKNSLEGDSQNGHGHKKSESVISEKVLQDDGQRSLAEDSALQQEFDDLMRSSSTMKVSLTPDRLKTMEVHKQEKDMRTSRRPAPLLFKSDNDSVSSKRPSLRHVDSIIEDEELAFQELTSPQPPPSNLSRIRQESTATPPTPSTTAVSSNRTRSVSTSSIGARSSTSRRKQPPPIPSAYPQTPRSMVRANKPAELHGFPSRTRKRQGNRESIDLDDIMAGSDNEEPPTSTGSARSAASPRTVSQSTRELMDFLAQGPPDEPLGPGGGLVDLLNSGPPGHHNSSSASLDAKPKGDRLRRMISKLSIGGNGEKTKNSYTPKTPGLKPASLPTPINTTPHRPQRLTNQNSLNGLSSLANRPVPPRPPRPPPPPSDHDISPPPSPIRTTPPVLSHSSSSSTPRNRPPSPALVPPRQDSRERASSCQPNVNGSAHSSVNGSANGHANGQIKPSADVVTSKGVTTDFSGHAIKDVNNSAASHQNRNTQTNAVAAPTQSGPTVGLSPNDVGHLHRLVSGATSVDECRLILDMFIARHKLPLELPSASASDTSDIEAPEDAALEGALVGYFLGEEAPLEGTPRVTSNGNSTPISIHVSGAESRPPTPIAGSQSIDNNSNTLFGEMKA